MSSFRALDQVASALLSSVGSEVSFRSVSTRVLLRTGVNLRMPKPTQASDPVAIGKVVSALTDMGYQL
ncbi:hypothetical protein [Pengzhenrongella sp.]|jgi:hypothetical protein|uniref:hypothetical protein n=1 Tax=Pengzhenrongella sp. TaxID=2888820 RepID=UPI002F9418A0